MTLFVLGLLGIENPVGRYNESFMYVLGLKLKERLKR